MAWCSHKNTPLPWSTIPLGRTGLDLGVLDSIGLWWAVLGSGGLCGAELNSVGLHEAVLY